MRRLFPFEDVNLFKQGLAKIEKVAVLKQTATNMMEKLAKKIQNMPDATPPKHTHPAPPPPPAPTKPPPPPPVATKAPAPPPAITKPPVSPSAESGPLSAAGSWDAGEPFGTMTLDQFDTMVDGAFSKHNGKFEGELTGNLLSGVWSAEQSATKCDKKRLGSFYWGNIQAAISSNGKKIHGKWGSCGLMPDQSFQADKAP